MAEAVKTSTAEIWLDEDGILQAVNLPGSHETLETARENVEASNKIMQGKPYLVLVDLRGLSSIERKARRFFHGPPPCKPWPCWLTLR